MSKHLGCLPGIRIPIRWFRSVSAQQGSRTGKGHRVHRSQRAYPGGLSPYSRATPHGNCWASVCAILLASTEAA